MRHQYRGYGTRVFSVIRYYKMDGRECAEVLLKTFSQRSAYLYADTLATQRHSDDTIGYGVTVG